MSSHAAAAGRGADDSDARQRFLLCFFDIARVTTNLVSFRALERSDFPLLQRWLSEPHVNAWWHDALDLAGLEQKYGRRIDGIEPTHVFIIEHESRPIGWIQWYRWSDYPKHAAKLQAEPNAAGIDLSIGEVSVVGKGIGSSAIREFILNVVSVEPGITAIVTDPEERNGRSCRAFEKAGFIPVRTVELEGENVRRRIMHLSLPASVILQ
jgi:RimJ/RimL family protein N-acetyltransferase